MIECEPTTAILRIGNGDPSDPFRTFSASGTLVYESRRVAWIKGLSGQVSRSQMRELLFWFSSQGLKTVKAVRAPGHRLPGFVEVGDHLELDVEMLCQKQPEMI